MSHPYSAGGTVWLIEPTRAERLAAQVLAMRPCPSARKVEKLRAERLDLAAAAPTRAIRGVSGKVGIIPVHGPIQNRLTPEGLKAGSVTVEEISQGFDRLLADPQVSAILFHVDSPGGEAYGIEELAEKVYASRGQKKTYAIADYLACSAAYWLASAAETLVATPSGDVGSIGVYVLHLDQSKDQEAKGIKATFISAGKYKTEGNPHEPLSDEARAYYQSEFVDYTYDKFLDALKRNRGVSLADVRQNFGQGRMVNAHTALAAGMIDRILTLEELLAKLTGQPAANGKVAASQPAVAVLRLRQEQRLRESAFLVNPRLARKAMVR